MLFFNFSLIAFDQMELGWLLAIVTNFSIGNSRSECLLETQATTFITENNKTNGFLAKLIFLLILLL